MKEDLMAYKDGVLRLIRRALEEDIGSGDITTSGVLTGKEKGAARTFAKSDTVIAGIEVFRQTFLSIDPDIRFIIQVEDGVRVRRGDVIARLEGRLGSILMAERVALNLFQRMCGIATLTHQLVEAVKGNDVKIIHTRKTAPGLRILDTYAVRVAGGYSHRFGLFDGALIKENHIAAAGGIFEAVASVRRRIPITVKVEVEIEDLRQLEEALRAGADVIMLDNMSIEAMTEAVKIVAGRVPLEASGNVTLANVRDIAATGVNFISSGALTHSVKAADISLRVEYLEEDNADIAS